MAQWEGDPGLFWANEMANNQEADWDFDALNEIDWQVWDELAPPPADLASSTDTTSLHQRNISSSTAATDSPGALFNDSVGTVPPNYRAPLTNAATSSATRRHHSPPQSSLQSQVSLQPTRPPAQPLTYDLPAQHSASRARPHQQRQRELSLVNSLSEDSSSRADETDDASYLLHPEIFETTPSSASSDSERERMPRTTTRPRQASGGVVDLTQETSPPPAESAGGSNDRQPHGRKRSAPRDSASKSRPNKRPRASSSTAASSIATNPPVEEFDLTNETTSAEEEVRRAQQEAAIAAQQAAENGDGPSSIGKRQCIICLEPYTDLTITHCGHVYCHECLTQALNAGEKNGERGFGTCPVCRKPVRRNRANQMIVVNFMKRETFRKTGKGRSLAYS